MTVKELIEKLKQFNENEEVSVYDKYWNDLPEATTDIKRLESNELVIVIDSSWRY